MKCTHEDWITFGEVIFQDATQRVVFVTCEDCRGVGAQVEQYDEENNDYVFISETWHKQPPIPFTIV